MNIDLNSLFSVRGKTTVITGAGGELCGVLSEALAKAGCHVAILDINMEAAEKREAAAQAAAKESGGSAAAFQCNVLKEESLLKCLEEVRHTFGDIDVLINGAGGNSPKGSTDNEFAESGEIDGSDIKGFFDLTYEGFGQTFDLNFLGTFLPTKVFTKEMAVKGEGNVINFSSMSALNPLTKVGAYSAAKAAVANFTQWLAVHLSHTGIRVNALAPGFFMTEQLRFLHINRETGEYTPRAKQVLAHTPMGRYGKPEELIGTVIWLMSEASRFVTGTVIPIDGGFSSYSI